jgi:hypothetical protein
MQFCESQPCESQHRPAAGGVVTVGRGDLWQQLDGLLAGRPGWNLQAMATPGSPPAWCFGLGGLDAFIVSVEGDRITVYEAELDRESRFATTDELAGWLQATAPGALGERKATVGDKLRGGRFFHWE